MKDYLTYEEFGAKGDGINDDFESIINCHNEANEKGLSVKAKDGATYYVGGSKKTAYIKTDVDFGTARIIIDDRNVESRQSYIFTVASDYESFSPYIKNLIKGQSNIDIPYEGNLFVRVFDSNKPIFIRKGLNMNNGTATSDCFTVDKNGNIAPSIDWNYPAITKTYARCTDDKPITIKGGIFTTIANQEESFYNYYKRGFCIERSHVTVTDVKHYVEGELDHGAPYHGFYYVCNCIDVTIKNALLSPRLIYRTSSKIPGRDVAMGSYDLSFSASIDVACINIRQTVDYLDTKYWGIYTSNFCKNLSLENCIISRFDAHQGVTNVSIRNCKIGHQQIKLIGFGKAIIENTDVRGSGCFIELRGDYGSTWDGDILIKNCSYTPRYGNTYIISSYNQEDHNYGYECYMPHNVELEGFKLLDAEHKDKENRKVCIFNDYNEASSNEKPYPYHITENLFIKDIDTESGIEFKVALNLEKFKSMVVKRG